MKRGIWILPNGMGPELEAIWEEPPAGLKYLAEVGETFRLAPIGASFEAEVVGLGLDYEIASGPLVVAGFDWQPPNRSVHFEMNLLSVNEEGIVESVDQVTDEEARILSAEFAQLETKKLFPRWGEQTTHGLVWEDGSIDLGCATATEAHGHHWEARLPEGDGELILRTLIDDSLNLLDGLELNQRRFDEGKPKANLLWPHSFGFRPELPNLPLRRGEIATILSDDVRLEGIARLVGYRHRERTIFRQGVHVSGKALRGMCVSDGMEILVDRGLGGMLVSNRGEEARYAVEKFDEGIWERIAIGLRDGEMVSGAILCPRFADVGLGLIFGSGVTGNSVPFDSRAWDDRRLRNLRFSEVMANLLGG